MSGKRFLNAADKSLWRLAPPMILSNITVPLLGLIDTAVIGHLDRPVYLAGAAVGTYAAAFSAHEHDRANRSGFRGR